MADACMHAGNSDALFCSMDDRIIDWWLVAAHTHTGGRFLFEWSVDGRSKVQYIRKASPPLLDDGTCIF